MFFFCSPFHACEITPSPNGWMKAKIEKCRSRNTSVSWNTSVSCILKSAVFTCQDRCFLNLYLYLLFYDRPHIPAEFLLELAAYGCLWGWQGFTEVINRCCRCVFSTLFSFYHVCHRSESSLKLVIEMCWLLK